jgi:glycosyltransferase involved in cell wall biosynthesis
MTSQISIPGAGRPIRVLELRSVRGTGGGPEKTILLGARRADPARFAVTVCYIRDGRDDVFAIDKWARELGVDYVEVHEKHSFDRAIWPALRTLVRERQIDIVHAHEHKTDLLAMLLARYERVIPLSTAHAWVGHHWREKIYYAVDKRLLVRFPHVVAVSSEIRDELVKHGGDPARITVILNAIDPNKFHRDPARRPVARAALGLQDDEIAIGAVGRLEPQKRFDLLMDAFARVSKDAPKLRLLIAGDGSLMAELTALIEKFGISGRCRLIGHTTDVPGFHHALDLFVQSSDYEGTPNAVLEAMALESPIVATDVGGTKELAHDREHALIVPPGQVDALAIAIREALANPQATAARARAARQRIETELSFDRRMDRLESIYERLVDERAKKTTGR